MLNRLALLAVSYLGFSSLALADDARLEAELAQIATLLKPSIGVTADFIQERTIPVLSRPLLSEGHISIPLDGEVVWAQDAPYAVVLKFTAEGMTEISPDGREHVTENPMVSSMGQTFISLLSGDPATLSSHFIVNDAMADEVSWSMTLQPKDDLLRVAIQTIKISGRENIDAVTVFDTQGGNSHIAFSNYQRSAQ